MKLKSIVYEDFLQYKKPSMFLICPICDFKCDLEFGTQICQNWEVAKSPTIEVDDDLIIKNYLNNPLTKSIVFGGLEPFCSFGEVIQFIEKLRNIYGCLDDIIIYSGYNKEEIKDQIGQLENYPNIIIKFGRYIPEQSPHFDEALGIDLASDNQYAEKIS